MNYYVQQQISDVKYVLQTKLPWGKFCIAYAESVT